MNDRPKRFEAIRGLDGLSPTGQQAVLDARVRLDVWIDENVDRIEAEMRNVIEAQRRRLSAEVAAVQEELAAARAYMSDILTELHAVDERLSSGDGMTVDEAVRVTRETVLSVKASLESREQRFRGLARAAASAGRPAMAGR